MASVKSRSKLAKRYEPTTPENQKFPKPPRYYMGVLMTEDDRIVFDDAIFVHLDNEAVKILNRDPYHPFDGLVNVDNGPWQDLRDGEEVEITEIQYAIGLVYENGKYLWRLFNHECEEPALLYLDEDDNSLILEAKMELDDASKVMDFKAAGIDGIRCSYPVTQFIN